MDTQKAKGSQQAVAAGKYTGSSTYSKKTKQSKWSTTSAAAFQSSSKRYKAHQFNLQTNTRPATIAGVTFQQNRHIQGAKTGKVKITAAFAILDSAVAREELVEQPLQPRRVCIWRMVLLNAGWWYPAWGC